MIHPIRACYAKAAQLDIARLYCADSVRLSVQDKV